MALIQWHPFSELERFFENDDWFLPVFSKSETNRPAIDLYETDKEIVAEASVAGFEPENLEISIENGFLKIAGKMEDKKEEKEKGYWRKEIRKGSFERVIKLPAEIDENKIEALYDKGILKITMPKVETRTSPKVKIKVKEK